MNTLEYRNGYAETEQDVIVALEDFLTTQVGGWSVVKKIYDTSTDRWYVFTSAGNTPGKYRPIYVSWRGYADNIYVYGYTYYESGGTYTDRLPDWTDAYMTIGNNVRYFFFADNDIIWIIIRNTNSEWFFAHAGYFNSYYSSALEEDYPLVVGASTYNSTFLNDGCMYCYGPWYTSVSGYNYQYYTHTDQFYGMLLYASPNTRDGSIGVYPPVMYRSSYPIEVRGELKGVYLTSYKLTSPGAWVTLSGTSYKYFAYNYTVDEPDNMLIGPLPVSSGTEWE